MCGIAGFLDSDIRPYDARDVLRGMISAISHRGPDGTGFHVTGPVGLAHARLSIIDLAAGTQPMCNEDRTVWITFNGEIFNYLELRDDLIRRGHKFRTRSDTEVIVHAYEEFGADCLKKLNGDFAFVISDERRRELFLARDRMGVRPLFYARPHGCLVFASEIKALLKHPAIRREADPIALDQIFTFWFPLAPRTGFKDIFELPPAHSATFKDGRLTLSRYWSIEYPDAADDRVPSHAKEADIESEVLEIFTDATRIRLRSDVPIGAYLSGGFDSSVTAAAIKRSGVSRLRTFSVEFDSAEYDESAFQKQMIDALGAEHSSIVCRPEDIGNLLPDTVWHAERPLLRTAPAPMLGLSRLVQREGFKVVLTGEGADEAFAGYDIFKEAKLRRFSARQPQSRMRRQLLRRLYPYLPGVQAQSEGFLAAFFAAGDLNDPLFSHVPRYRSTAGTKAFFSNDLRREIAGYDALADLREQLPAAFARWHPLSQAQYLETVYLLPQYILSSQGDRMGMASAVEGRFPFLDHRLVELGARIPAKLKIRVLQEKAVLRRSIGTLLPPAIAQRQKQPYRAPSAPSFFGAKAPAYVAACLSKTEIANAGCFNPDAVEKLRKKAEQSRELGTRDQMAVVGILSTQLWHASFLSGATGKILAVKESQQRSQEQDPRNAAI